MTKARRAAGTDDLTPALAQRMLASILSVIRADRLHDQGYRHIDQRYEPIVHQALLNAVLDGRRITYPDGTDSTDDIRASARDINRAFDGGLPRHAHDQ